MCQSPGLGLHLSGSHEKLWNFRTYVHLIGVSCTVCVLPLGTSRAQSHALSPRTVLSGTHTLAEGHRVGTAGYVLMRGLPGGQAWRSVAPVPSGPMRRVGGKQDLAPGAPPRPQVPCLCHPHLSVVLIIPQRVYKRHYSPPLLRSHVFPHTHRTRAQEMCRGCLGGPKVATVSCLTSCSHLPQ